MDEPPEPSAKEIAAALAARQRLGYDDGGERAERPAASALNLPTGVMREVDVEYTATADLAPYPPGADLEAERAATSVLLAGEKEDWLATCTALDNLRRLAVHHPTAVADHLPALSQLVLKSLKSPRSGLLKTAVSALEDLGTAFGDRLAPHLAETPGGPGPLLQLLLAARADKKFVAEAADRALSTLVARLTPRAVAPLLVGACGHVNPKVRAKAAAALAACLARLSPRGDDGLGGGRGLGTLHGGSAPLLRAAAALVADRQPEARDAARAVIAAVAACLPVTAGADGDQGRPGALVSLAAGRALEAAVAECLDATSAAAVLKSVGLGRK